MTRSPVSVHRSNVLRPSVQGPAVAPQILHAPMRPRPSLILCLQIVSQDVAIFRGVPYLGISGPTKLAVVDNVASPACAQQICRRGNGGARQEHRLDPFDEPMKARARPNRLAACMYPCSMCPCVVCSPAGQLFAYCAAAGRWCSRWRCAPVASHRGATGGGFWPAPEVRSGRQGSKTTPKCSILTDALAYADLLCPFFCLAGASVCGNWPAVASSRSLKPY